MELWDPACCQYLHVWICKTGYLQAGLCQQRGGQSCYCWKSRLGFKENDTSHHSDIGSKRAVHKHLEGELPYLQEGERTSEKLITSWWAVLPEQCMCALQWMKNRTLNKRCGHGSCHWKWRYCWVHSEQGWEKQPLGWALQGLKHSFPGYQQGWDDVRSLQHGQEEDQ